MRWVNQGQPKTHPFTDFRYLNLRFLIKNVFFPPKLNRNSKIPLWKWKNFRLNSSISHINQKFQIICSSWIAAKLVKKKPDIKPFFADLLCLMDPAAAGLSIDTPIGCRSFLPLAYFSGNLLVVGLGRRCERILRTNWWPPSPPTTEPLFWVGARLLLQFEV